MVEQYKLRLGDGTVLAIDRGGLHTWLLDRKAMVQAPGSRRWRPLKQLLDEGLPEEVRSAPPSAPAPAPRAPEPPAPAPATVAAPPVVEADEDPPFHVSPAPEGQTLFDVARAEVERHGGDEPVWQWTPSAVPAATAAPSRAPGVPSDTEAAASEVASDDVWPEVAVEAEAVPPAAVPLAEAVPLAPLPTAARVAPTAADPAATPLPAPPLEIWPIVTRAVERMLRPLPGWVDGLIGRVQRWTAAPAAGHAAAPSPEPDRQVALPPPPLRDLPVLRFKPTEDEPATDRTVSPRGRGRAGRRWEVRALMASGLAGLAVVAFSTRSMWMPGPGPRGAPGRAVSPLPPAPPSMPEASPLPKEVLSAVDQLPHLSPETIQLVMARSERGLPDPAEVFRRAHAAASRGAALLGAEEAEELRGLRGSVLATLRRRDADRVRAYDRMSPVRDLLVSEDARVLALFARGVRTLAPDRRQRLQALLGKAVAADLGPRAAASPY
ncbi:MAG TPA: hypothetical protein VMR21_06645 [Vicinamibacteria bacterium]|nr:hypothetical protein [Vicinamibacteria bacterium]